MGEKHHHDLPILRSNDTGKRPLDRRQLARFKQLVELYRDDIVHKWIDFFVYNKPVESEMITKKI